MNYPDPPITFLICASAFILLVLLTTGLVVQHTHVRFPRWSRYAQHSRDREAVVGRRALLVEIPLWIALVGGGEFVVVLILVDSPSLPVRLIAAIELAASVAWLAFLGRKIASRS